MADNYVWLGSVSTAWNVAGNWEDVTSGKDPATSAPNADDDVTIGPGAGGATDTVSGTGNLASAELTLAGSVKLQGDFVTSALTASGTLTVASGDALTDSGAASFASSTSIDGGTVTVAGAAAFGSSLTLNGGSLGVGSSTGLGTLTLVGAVSVGGDLTTGSLVDSQCTSLTLLSGVFDVTNAQPGTLALLMVTGVSNFEGSYKADVVTVARNGSLTLGQADSLTEQSADFEQGATVTLDEGTMIVTGAATLGGSLDLTGAGSFTVEGATTTYGGMISASDNSHVLLASLSDADDGITLSVDGTSSIEIGSAGDATSGTITIDAGDSITESDEFIAPNIVDAGTIAVTAGKKLTIDGTGRGLSGAGVLQINAGSSLTLEGIDPAATNTIDFATGGLLWLTPSDLNSSGKLVTPISGFGSTDVIEFDGAVTGASYSSSSDLLTLLDGSTVVANLSIGAGYANAFATLTLGSGPWTQIDYLGGGTDPAPAGTATADAYTWTGQVAGRWDALSNWTDTTTEANPAAVGPGANDSVTVQATASGAAQVIIGNGNASSLTIEGETLLDGKFQVGSLDLTENASQNPVVPYLVLETGDSVAVSQSADFGLQGAFTLEGGDMTVGGSVYTGSYTPNTLAAGGELSAAAVVVDRSYYKFQTGGELVVSGEVSDSGQDSVFAVDDGVFTVSGSFVSSNDTIDAASGGIVQLAKLQQAVNPSGGALESVTLAADALSSIEIGTAGHAATGAITIDSGVTLTEAGEISAPHVDVAGTLVSAADESLEVSGVLTGSGELEIGAASTLFLDDAIGSSAETIDFVDPGAVLKINPSDLNASKTLVPKLSGFGATNALDFGGVATSATYSNGTLTLWDDSIAVANVTIGAGYSNVFSTIGYDDGLETQVNYLGGGANAAPAGTTSSDVYDWVGPLAGDWNVASNWNDTSQGSSSIAPGKNDLVTIGAQSDGAAQVIIGDGNATALTIEGTTLFVGTFTAGNLSVTQGSVVLYADDSLALTGGATFQPSTGATLDGGALSLGGTLTAGLKNSVYTIEANGELQASALDDSHSFYFVSSGGELAVGSSVADGVYDNSYFTLDDGVFTVGGTFTAADDYIYASNKSRVQIASLVQGSGEISLTADSTSSIEIGTVGNAAKDAITIDKGASAVASGFFSAADIVNQGTLVDAGWLLTLSGALSGGGIVEISAGAGLVIENASQSETGTINFAGPDGALGLGASDVGTGGTFIPGITGFTGDDIIDFAGVVTRASYGNGVLTLLDGGAAVAYLSIGAGYSNAFSAISIDGGFETQIDYLGGGTNAAPAGTSAADEYIWSGPVAGDWNAVANWTDSTTGQTPAAVAPGAKDAVTIQAAAGGAAQVIIGNGNASSLTIEGETLLDGKFSVGSLTVETLASLFLYGADALTISGAATFDIDTGAMLDAGAMTVDGTLDADASTPFTIEDDGVLTAGALSDGGTVYDIASGGRLTVAGNVSDTIAGIADFSLDDAFLTISGTLTAADDAIGAANNSHVQIAVLNGASGPVRLTADSSSSIEIGKAGSAAPGAITVDAGVTSTESGSFTAPKVIVTGTLATAAGQALMLTGALSGSGTVDIASGSTLTLTGMDPASTNTIDYTGSGGTLRLYDDDLNSLGAIAAKIVGFSSAEVLDFQGAATSASYAGGVLTLLNGAKAVAKLALTGTFSNAFSALPIDSGQWTQIDYLGGGTNAAPAGTTSSDNYVWSGPVAGSWNTLANWTDTTTATHPAAAGPGSNDLVTIEAAANGAAQVIIGNGDAAALTIEGETLLDGTFLAGSLDATAGIITTFGTSAGLPVLYAGDSLTVSGAATFGGDAGAILLGGEMSVAGTLYSSQGSAFTIEDSGSLTVGALVDNQTSYNISGGGSLTVAGNVTDGNSGRGVFTLDDGDLTVEGSLISSDDSIVATIGSRVQVGALQQGVNSGVAQPVALSADTTSSIEIGTAGKAAAAAITIDPGVTLTESGAFAATDIVDKGTLIVSADEALTLNGSLTGGGSVDIGAGSTLSLTDASASTDDSIDFTGAGGTLSLAGSDLNPTKGIVPTISGFASGDIITYGGLVTALAYVDDSLTLLDNGSTVAVLDLAGNYSGWTYYLDESSSLSEFTVAQGGDSPPGAVAPPQISSGANVDVPVAGVSVYDATAIAKMTVTLSASKGDLIAVTSVTGGGGTISGSGSMSLTISGTIAQVNADLTTLEYDAQAAADDSISITASNGIGGSTNQTIAVAYDPSFPDVTIALAHDTGNNDDITSNAALQGTGNANAVVSFTIDGVASSKTVTANSAGAWSYTPTGLPQGTNTVTASETDSAKNTGSAFLTFTYDTVAPAVTITSTGGAVGQAKQTINGTIDAADSGLTVTIYDGTTAVGTATPAANGVWSASILLNSSSGSQAITARATDAAGNVGTSNAIAFALESLAPTLTIADSSELPNSTAQALTGTIDTGDSGLSIAIYDGSTLIGHATANSAGAWFGNFTLSGAGPHVLTAQATNVVGATVSNAVDLAIGGNQTINFTDPAGNAASLWNASGGWDLVNGNSGTIYLSNAQAAVAGGGDTVIFEASGGAVSLYDTGNVWDTVNAVAATIYLNSAQTSLASGDGGDTIDFASGSGNAISLYDTSGGWDLVNGSNGTILLNGAQTAVAGGGDTLEITGGSGNAASLYNTGSAADVIYGSGVTTYLTSALASVVGGGNSIDFAGGSGNAVSLYNTSAWDVVSGSQGTVYLTSAQAAVVGGADVVNFAGGAGNIASLYDTSNNWDQVSGSGGAIYLTGAQTSVSGGLENIYFSGGTGDAASLYNTSSGWDLVSGSGPTTGTVYLNSSQAAVVGGGETVSFASGSGNAASLYDTSSGWDLVSGSGPTIGTVYLNSAQAAVVGGGETISFAGGSGDAAGLYDTSSNWDLVSGSGATTGTVSLNSAQATVVGGGETIDFASGSGNAASLYDTAGNWDLVNGFSGSVYMTNAQAGIAGSNDTIAFSGANSVTQSGASDAFVFQPAIGEDTINGFASTDSMQFSAADFANWSALAGHVSQSGANTLITLDATDQVTLANVTATSLTASQFHFV